MDTFLDDLERFRRLVLSMADEICAWNSLLRWEPAQRFLEQAVVRHNKLVAEWRETPETVRRAVRLVHAPQTVEWASCARAWETEFTTPKGTLHIVRLGEGTNWFHSYTDAVVEATAERHETLSFFPASLRDHPELFSFHGGTHCANEPECLRLDAKAVADAKHLWANAPLWQCYAEMDLAHLRLLVEQEFLVAQERATERAAREGAPATWRAELPTNIATVDAPASGVATVEYADAFADEVLAASDDRYIHIYCDLPDPASNLADEVHRAVIAVVELRRNWARLYSTSVPAESRGQLSPDDRGAAGSVVKAWCDFNRAKVRIRELLKSGAVRITADSTWPRELLDAVDRVYMEYKSPQVNLAGELARCKRYAELADRLYAAYRQLAYAYLTRDDKPIIEQLSKPADQAAAEPLVGNEVPVDQAIRAGCGSLKEISKRTGIDADSIKNHVIPALKKKRGLLSKPYRYPESM